MTNSSRRAELADLRPNDLVRLSEVLRVESVDRHDGTLNVVAVNEKHGRRWRLGYPGTKIELLHRPKAKPAVGDVITGKQFRETMWKTGTAVVDGLGSVYVLMASGELISSSGTKFPFQAFHKDEKFKLIHLGQ